MGRACWGRRRRGPKSGAANRENDATSPALGEDMLGGKAKERLQPEVSEGEGTEGRVGDEARAGKGRIGTGEWEEGGHGGRGGEQGKGSDRVCLEGRGLKRRGSDLGWGSFQDPRTLRLQPCPADFSGLGWARHELGRVAGPDSSQTSR